ncbi:ArdC family protein [Hymenobacter cheonanensis]|uniref:ArdC family protein n=1 Tax=Hymenobacter sp. CA2-7 TaxID=3063993 RepID=UPI00271269B8|nr:zincin-like metallopeptidase domain-containing protein [Hymenobacter sp. CA2-7]MDO7887836.1 zincin-like metallopeptidase domain-containing protein [Hymenobacter sp. CA2-7]
MKKPAPFAPRPDVYEIITNRIILALENGVTPWKQPWNAAHGAPRNYRSKHVYQGVNALLLGMLDYEHPYFLTYNQAKELGGQVRRGEKGMPVVFFTVTKKDDGKGEEKKKAFLKYSTVFNVAQIDGVDWNFPELPSREHTPEQAAELVLAGYVGGPRVLHKGSEALYRTSTDTVTMPAATDFHTAEDYYHTLFHELTHSTGHAKRLDRATLTELAAFGSETYAKEELVAELGASFLSHAAGLDLTRTEPSSASYIANWLQALRNDKQLIISAASQGQKAANHILGIVPSYEVEEAPGTEVTPQ